MLEIATALTGQSAALWERFNDLSQIVFFGVLQPRGPSNLATLRLSDQLSLFLTFSYLVLQRSELKKMASAEQVDFNDPHAPHANAVEAFNEVLAKIKSEIVKSRHDWDKHEPKMWSRAQGLSDHELTNFTVENDLVLVRSGGTSYGNIILGKIRIPAVNDAEGEGFIHVRIHDPPNRGTEDVMFHSLWTDEGSRDAEGRPTTWRAIHNLDTPLEFFNE
ncbi:hypothetical protein NP233_g3589 [Leucocoprinus birnbaumii]|uniref:Uncharacterized protein n=1 Tax=Leucocoprinus birnbaumii TaxID=56174 RepID=A0AAD5YXW0_9AGAR|nr:hypothetical protein NP233_g3589 [Leucocoprinus birnbaumii]